MSHGTLSASQSQSQLSAPPISIWVGLLGVLCAAMAGGMAWGIRGQYGHESGAMITGPLVGFTLILFYASHITNLTGARAVAMMTVAVGIGGSMTYGQTVGLTHDGPLVGHWGALRWGLLGLFIKGGIWIAIAATFFGMGLGGKRYRCREIVLLMLALICLMFLGIWVLNTPFDPATKQLPSLYFSDSWFFEPEPEVPPAGYQPIKPRFEMWGGLLFAWIGLTAYVSFIRHDKLARNLALIGFVAGGLGFSGGQCVQAFHAWNPETFQTEFWSTMPVNWWNMMETTFGLILGAILAIGVWFNRHLISSGPQSDEVTIAPPWEVTLCVIHIILLVAAEFWPLPEPIFWFSQQYIQWGLVMSTIPLIGIVGGRYWPYLMTLPVLTIPIAGKTMRGLAYAEEPTISVGLGALVLMAIPIGIATIAAAFLISAQWRRQSVRAMAAWGLLVTSWLFYGLNSLFFHFGWPWVYLLAWPPQFGEMIDFVRDRSQWDGRTHSGLIFALFVSCLTVAALWGLVTAWRQKRERIVEEA